MKYLTARHVTALIGMVFLMTTSPAMAETQEINKSFDVKSGGTLRIKSDNGKIAVETWSEDKVAVEVRKKAKNKERLERFEVTISKKGNDIVVYGESGFNSRVRVSYVVKVPKKYNVNLQTGGGSIQVSDIQGGVTVDTSGGSITIGNVTGGNNVDANTSGGSIKVGDVDGNLKVDTSGGSIKLGSVKGKSTIETSGGSISLEKGGNDVVAETSGGSIKIGPVKGNVAVETSGGSIVIDKAEGNVKADTSGGSIKVMGSKGKIEVETAGGSIFIGSSNGPVIAETAGGKIRILQARGYIEAETAGGSIEAEMIETNNKVDSHVYLDTAGGSITVYLPKNFKASITAELKITRSAKRDYRIYSDFPLTIKGEKSDKVTASGDINGGGDKVILETTNGDIHIRMLKN